MQLPNDPLNIKFSKHLSPLYILSLLNDNYFPFLTCEITVLKRTLKLRKPKSTTSFFLIFYVKK